MKIALFGIILTLSFTDCFPDTYNGLKDFEQRLKHADEAELRGDYVAAENEVKSAEAIAKGINWNDGVITAKLRLGRTSP